MNTNYYCPYCGREIEYYFQFCCWCGQQLNHTEIVNSVDEENKFSFTREDYTYNGPVPTIYYQ